MATLLITVTASHPSYTPIAEAFSSAGSPCLVHTRQDNYAKVQAAGAELVPMSEDCDIRFRVVNSSMRPPWWLPAFGYELWRSSCNDPIHGCRTETIIKQEQVDCLVGDYMVSVHLMQQKSLAFLS